MTNFSIKYRLEYDGSLHSAKGNKLDQAYRLVKDRRDNAIHTANGRLTLEQFKTRCIKNGITLLYVYEVSKKSYLYESAEWQERDKSKKQKEQKESIPKEIKTEVKTEVIPEVKTEVKSAPTSKDSNGMHALAEMLKPHFNFSELSKDEIHAMVKAEFQQHAKVIEIKKHTGEVKKLGHQHYLFERILKYVNRRKNLMLVGPAGSGKTHTAHAVAKALDLDFYAISVGMMTTKTDFFGYKDANGNYVRTQFRDAFENGGVFLLDEMDAGNANVLTTINMALANDSASFPDKMVERHKDFVLVAGANTYGTGSNREYVGRNQLDAATLNRFNMIQFPYDEALEDAITQHINPRFTKYCQKLRANINRLKIRHIISPRQSIDGGEMLNDGLTISEVEEDVLFKNLSNADINRIKDGVIF